MPIEYKKYPTNWKTEIRPSVMERAKGCCEFCGVKNYAVGNWDADRFIPTAGNKIHDMAGNGELSYKEARELVTHCNDWCEEKFIIIVLTVAHLDHDITNNELSNLKALCQRCHNRYDIKFRVNNRRINKGYLPLFNESK